MDSPRQVPHGFSVRYRLGSGQTSNVWLALHASLGNVALKLPRPEVQDKPVLRRMFENEVQITLSLRHPNIVAGYAGMPTGPGAYLALEYCAGGTLDQRLLEKRVGTFERAALLVADVAAGLEYTHGQQVLHRDVKPANVFLTEDGTAKLGDFGTGCYMTDENADRVGTAFYMAPEIFMGQAASTASDVYSLGILAYEVLTGQRPFLGETYEQVMHAHTTSLPRPIEYYRSDVPRGVQSVISRAMSREAARRYGSVREFRLAFEREAGLAELKQQVETGRASRRVSDTAGQSSSKEGRRGLFAWLRRRR